MKKVMLFPSSLLSGYKTSIKKITINIFFRNYIDIKY